MAIRLPFTKGHGTENDFVIVDDPDNRRDLSADQVRAVCDRRAGIGGDGLIRVVRSRHVSEAAAQQANNPDAEWFMDYRNADGSIAELCGNGVRVFAEFLLREGHLNADQVSGGTGTPIVTRAGVRRVTLRPDGWWAVDMGTWEVPGGAAAVERGYDVDVHLAGLDVSHPGLRLDLGNPHTVVMLTEDELLDGVDLTTPPLVDPAPAPGPTVEVLSALEPQTRADGGMLGRLRMRVHERGVGETRSCGTGACAAAAAAALWAGPAAPARWLLDVPGGQVEVRLGPGLAVELSGPAELVADGDLVIG